MFLNEHQNLQHQLFRIRFTELNEIFLIMSLRSFVISMIGIFVPIYLYTLGYTLREIFLLYIYQYIIEALFEFLALKLNIRIGPKHTIALSMPFLIINFLLLRTLPVYGWPLWTISASAGICLAFYWQAYHYDFSKSKSKNNSTNDVSKLFIILAILGAVAPLIGGFIATSLGIKSLFSFVIILMVLVFVGLLKQGEKHNRQTINFSRIKFKKIYHDIISYGGSGLEASASMMIWPLFIYAILGTYQRVGLVTSIGLILTIGITYFIGKRVNNYNRSKYIKCSGWLNFFTYSLQTLVNSFGQVLFFNVVRSFNHSLHAAPYVSEYYLHADENSRAEYIFLMETSIDVFRLFMFVILYIMTFLLSNNTVLMAGLIFGAIGSLMTTVMPKAKCETKACTEAKLKVSRKIS